MQILTKCGRCGALVETRKTKFADGTSAYYSPCVAVTEISSNNTLVSDGCDTATLCPDCMEQLKEWLTGESQEAYETNSIAETDTAESLVRDMAKALNFFSRSGYSACRYFGNKSKCHGCPAASTDEVNRGCFRFMCADIRRRCEALGIDLEEDADAE